MATPTDFDPQSLITPVLLTASGAVVTYYTAPSGGNDVGVRIESIRICGISGASQPTVYIVESGGAADTGSSIFTGAISSASTSMGMGTWLDPGDTIRISLGAGTVMGLHIYGNEVSNGGTASPAEFDFVTLTPVLITSGGSVNTYYTSPTGAGTRGTRLYRIIINRTSGGGALNVHHVESGGTAGNANLVHNATVFGAGETMLAGAILNPGDTIQASLAAGTVDNIHLWGLEMTD